MLEIIKITQGLSLGLLDLQAFSAASNIGLKRELEKAGARFVLGSMLAGESFKLGYTPENKPFLENSEWFISISHSHDRLVIALNREEETGVDIELVRDMVLKIRHKFVSEMEMGFTGEDVERLITLWAAKEAMYKYYGLKNLDFKQNLSVEYFDGEFIFGKIETKDYKKRLRLAWQKLGGYMLVYVLNQMND